MIRDWVTYTICILLILLVIFWGCQGRAQTANNPTPPACYEIQQACDEVIMEADKLILMQLRAYTEISKTNELLEQDMKILREQNFSLKNPPWYKDPMWTGLAGVLGGVVLMLNNK